MGNELTLRTMLSQDNVTNRFREIMKDRAPAFITSIINVSESSAALKKVAQDNPRSIISAAAVAAALNLPIDKNLGFAWIVPYGNAAQFQMGWKGFVQLALRTAQYLKLNAVVVHKDQFKSYNALTEQLEADFGKPGTEVGVGVAVYFKLVNGFEKTSYYSMEQLMAHGKRYSKAFNDNKSPWTTHRDEMCLKTAVKMTLSKWGILSSEMQMAQQADQAVVHGDNPQEASFEYVDATISDKPSTKPEVTPDQVEVVESPAAAEVPPMPKETPITPPPLQAAPEEPAKKGMKPEEFRTLVRKLAFERGLQKETDLNHVLFGEMGIPDLSSVNPGEYKSVIELFRNYTKPAA